MLKYLCAGVVLVVVGCAAAAAAPLAPQDGEAHIILVRGGCGPGMHPSPYGACVPNRGAIVAPREVAPREVGPDVVAPVRLPPPCPRGYYRDPRPNVQLCYPRF